MRNFLRYYIPVLFWCLLIFTLSSIPGLKLTETWWDLILRKGAHLFMYLVLFLLTYRALINAGPASFSKQMTRSEIWIFGFPILGINLYIKARASFVVSFSFSALYALSDEIHQAFVPNRSGNFIDFFINLTGIFLAITLVKIYERKAH